MVCILFFFPARKTLIELTDDRRRKRRCGKATGRRSLDASCRACSLDHVTRRRERFGTTASSRPPSFPSSVRVPTSTLLPRPPSLSCVMITPLSKSAGFSSRPEKCRSSTPSMPSPQATEPPSLQGPTSSFLATSLPTVRVKTSISPGPGSAQCRSFARQTHRCRNTFSVFLSSSSVIIPFCSQPAIPAYVCISNLI